MDRESFTANTKIYVNPWKKEMKMAYKNACKQVRRILIEDCQLIEQIRCIKQYVLLCKGISVWICFELLWEGLNRPAGSLFRHNLVGVLESSIDSTRDPREPDWLLAIWMFDCFLMIKFRIQCHRMGCICFRLSCQLPVDCVLDPQSMQSIPSYPVVFGV